MKIKLLIIALTIISAPLYSASLRVSPSMVTFHNVQNGKKYDVYKDTGVRFTIYNDDSISKTWNLAIYSPAERGHTNKQYKNIKNTNWCWLDKYNVTVNPDSFEHINLFFQIPDHKSYYNKKWMAVIGIDGQTDNAGISLSADLLVFIETFSNISKGGLND